MPFTRLIDTLYKWYLTQRNKWLKKRIPSNNSIQLNINNTFILPSGFGWSVLGIAICLFVLGTNFQNNTILLLCYFLIAVVLISLFHNFFFFTQHAIVFNDIEPDFENRQLQLSITVNSKQTYEGGALHFIVAHTSFKSRLTNKHNANTSLSPSQITVAMATNTSKNKLLDKLSTHLKLPLPAISRGVHPCPQITVKASYAFGLFNCWTHLTPQLQIVVYPAMKKSVLKLHQTHSDLDATQSSDSQYVISDNLQGIREYQSTDPIYHISWKHLAKGQGMLTKDFSENQGVSGWLKLDDFKHISKEEALQCLCFQIQELNKDHVQFGVDLGSTKILPQQGVDHVRDCLMQLALYQEPTLASEQVLKQASMAGTQ